MSPTTTSHPLTQAPRSTRLALVTSAVLAASQAALGQPAAQPASASNTLEEVIITAQKRSENLQSVPISVEAIDNKRLGELKISDFNSVAKYLPSVSVQSYGPGQAQIYFRGVTNGSDGAHTGSSPMVGVYLDEQSVTTIGNTLDPHVYDMARIEALSGPQGTLFGANSMEGTLRYITNKPDHTGIYGGYDLTLSEGRHRGFSEKVEGFLNVPVTEQVAIRLVGYGERDAGYIDNVLGPNEVYPTSGVVRTNAGQERNNFNSVGTSGGRAHIKIDLNDRWTVSPSVIYQKQGAYGSFNYQPGIGDLQTAQYGPALNNDQWYQSALTIEGKIADLDLTYSGGYMRRTIDNVFDYSDYSYAYDRAYASQPQYFGNLFRNNAGEPISPAQSVVSHNLFTKRSHELRIASPSTDRFRFVLGAFYQAQRNDALYRYEVAGLADAYSITGQPGVHYLDANTRYDTDRAIFTEMNYNLTDNLIATVGARVFDYRINVNGFFGFAAQPLGSDGTPYYQAGEVSCTPIPTTALSSVLPCLNVNSGSQGGKYTDKFTLTYKFDPDRMIYSTYSTGFRPGGINRNPLVAPFKPDYLNNFELGWKTSWFGRTLRLNGALFSEKWTQAQFGTVGQYSITQIINSGGAETQGIESDIHWLATDGLTLSGSATYLWKHDMTGVTCDATPTGPNCALGDPPVPTPGNISAPAGTTTPISPAFKGNVSVRYEFQIQGIKAHAQASGLYQTTVIPALKLADAAVYGSQPAYGSMDVTAGASRNNWTAELSIENLADRRGQITRTISCTSSVCNSTNLPTGPYVTPIRPRTYTLQFGQRF